MQRSDWSQIEVNIAIYAFCCTYFPTDWLKNSRFLQPEVPILTPSRTLERLFKNSSPKTSNDFFPKHLFRGSNHWYSCFLRTCVLMMNWIYQTLKNIHLQTPLYVIVQNWLNLKLFQITVILYSWLLFRFAKPPKKWFWRFKKELSKPQKKWEVALEGDKK